MSVGKDCGTLNYTSLLDNVDTELTARLAMMSNPRMSEKGSLKVWNKAVKKTTKPPVGTMTPSGMSLQHQGRKQLSVQTVSVAKKASRK